LTPLMTLVVIVVRNPNAEPIADFAIFSSPWLAPHSAELQSPRLAFLTYVLIIHLFM